LGAPTRNGAQLASTRPVWLILEGLRRISGLRFRKIASLLTFSLASPAVGQSLAPPSWPVGQADDGENRAPRKIEDAEKVGVALHGELLAMLRRAK